MLDFEPDALNLLQFGLEHRSPDTPLMGGPPEGPAMDHAYYMARRNTTPDIVPNVTDHVWYHEHYPFRTGNRLEAESFTNPAVQPTPEQIAAEEQAEGAAWAALRPRLEYEASEAAEYYERNFTAPGPGNDLEAFTYARNNSMEAADNA